MMLTATYTGDWGSRAVNVTLTANLVSRPTRTPPTLSGTVGTQTGERHGTEYSARLRRPGQDRRDQRHHHRFLRGCRITQCHEHGKGLIT